MSGPPNVSPALLAKARNELDAMVTGLIPEGKRGAVIGVADASGAQFGLAAKVLGDSLQVDLTVVQRWKQERPTAKVTVIYSW